MDCWMFCFVSAGLILLSDSSEGYADYDMCENMKKQVDVNDDFIVLYTAKTNCTPAKTSKSCSCQIKTSDASGSVTFLYYKFRNVSCSNCRSNWTNVKVESTLSVKDTYKTLANTSAVFDLSTFDVRLTMHSECISNFLMVFETNRNNEFSKLKCSTVSVPNLGPTSDTDKFTTTEDDGLITLTELPTSSHPMSDRDANSSEKKSSPLTTGAIVGIVVGVVGGVILIIVVVAIGIKIRRRRLEKQDRFGNLSEARHNKNTINENSYANPIIQPDELITSAQPHLVGSHEGLETDGTYVATMTQDTDVGRNLEPLNNSNEVNSYYNLSPKSNEENDTNLVENDLYGIEDGSASVEGDLIGNANDTTLVENDLYVK